MTVYIPKHSFSRGAVSSTLHQRRDSDLYADAAAEVVNWIPLRTGGITKRPGTRYLGAAKYGDKKTRLVPYIYNASQSYVLEVGHQYIRFWTERGQLAVSSVPVEVATPYLETEIDALQFAVLFDVIYICHPNHFPRQLRRDSSVAWSFGSFPFIDGPYLNLNSTGTSVRVGAASGTDTTVPTTGTSYTLTFSSVTGINDGQGFNSTDIGRLVRIMLAGKYSWFAITAVTNTTTVTAICQDGNGSGGGTVSERTSYTWTLGAFCNRTGFPRAVEFFEGRLMFGGTPANPRGVWASMSGLPAKFSPTDVNGLVLESSGFYREITSGQADPIHWFVEAPRLQFGTLSAIRTLAAPDSAAVMTPNNATPRIEVTIGASATVPVSTGSSTIFAGRNGKALFDLHFDYDVNALVADELSVLSDDLFTAPVKGMTFQQAPFGILWAWQTDGRLLAVTLDKKLNCVAWTAQNLGAGSSVQSASVIPNDDLDDTYFLVRRTIDGNVVQYVEVLERFWDKTMDKADAFYVDCGITYTGAAANVITGLAHLEGKEVDILADGAPASRRTVEDASVTLSTGRTASKVHLGIPIVNKISGLPVPTEAPDGATIGRRVKITRAYISVVNTGGIEFSALDKPKYDLRKRTANVELDEAQPLRTEIWDVQQVSDSWNNHGRFEIVSTPPLPATVACINVGIDSEP